jgi:polyhydroxyalkanoate synthesis regulator phasin
MKNITKMLQQIIGQLTYIDQKVGSHFQLSKDNLKTVRHDIQVLRKEIKADRKGVDDLDERVQNIEIDLPVIDKRLVTLEQ